ncbi:MAG: lytic transglycosylase domain-containing protein, partial [Sphingobium sp.]
MIRTSLVSLALIGTGLTATTAQAAPDDTLRIAPEVTQPLVANGDVRMRYRAIFAAIDEQRWPDAMAQIATLDEGDDVRSYALAELYLAKNSPKVELFDLLALVNKASWLPQADQLSRLAQRRGAQILPTLPQVQKLVWLGAA